MSTTTSTRRVPRPTPVVRRAVVRDLTARQAAEPIDVEFDVRTAYDFLVSLVLEEEPELLPEDAEWLAAARASLSDGVRRELARMFRDSETHHMGLGAALIPLVVADPGVRTAADVVALAGRIGAAEIVGASCEIGAHDRAVSLATGALGGDAGAHDELVAICPEKSRPALERLLSDPEGELRSIRRVLRAWSERFVAIEPRVARMLERDVASRRGDAAGAPGAPVADLVEHVTGGVRFTPETGITRVILAPSYFARPCNYLFGERDWRMYCYPLADAALDGDPSALPGATIRLFKALGDETRLRILRSLGDGDLYLTEIAERMALSKPTVRHHMILLRAAGLVTVTETGGLTYYSLRRDRIADATPDLQRLLGA